MKTFAIHESNLERLQKKITRIRTKCETYGCDFYYQEVGEEFRKVKLDVNSPETVERFVLVECEGTAIVNGWRFVATVDHTDNGNIIRSLVDDVDVPDRYYTCGPECEHCKSKRHRKDTYIIYNQETKEFKQVGSSCLCDFTHGFSAEAAAQYISLFDSLIQGKAPGEGFQVSTWMQVRDILKYAVSVVKHLGYTSTSAQYYDGQISTRSIVSDQWLYDNIPSRLGKYDMEKVKEFRNKFGSDFDQYKDMVNSIIEYFKSVEENSDYMHNLKVIANSEYIDFKTLGYAVSMVPTYNRVLEKEAAKKRYAEEHSKEIKKSQFVGQVKDRITVVPEDIKVIATFENSYGYYSSTTTRYKITGEDGNVYMWDCSTYVEEDKEVESIVGTVKKHDEFRGVKQTWLTRCKIKYVEDSKHGDASDDVQKALDVFYDEVEDRCTSATEGDYSPSSPWDAPGMSIKDFI